MGIDYVSLLIGIGAAIAFSRIAAYERMSPFAWVTASLGISFVLYLLHGGVVFAIVAQCALYCVMWWYNARRDG